VTYRHEEEHVLLLVQGFEPTGVIRKFITGVCCRCVSKEDTLDLVRKLCSHSRIVCKAVV